MLGDWTDRIAKGEAPKQAPPRPRGVERNIVVSLVGLGHADATAGPTIGADLPPQPTLNANGQVYGVSQLTDLLTCSTRWSNRATNIKVPVQGAEDRREPGALAVLGSGDDLGAHLRSAQRGDGCAGPRAGSPAASASNGSSRHLPSRTSSATTYPLKSGGRQIDDVRSEDEAVQAVDTCFSADHNQISRDNVIYFGMNGAVGWVDLNA